MKHYKLTFKIFLVTIIIVTSSFMYKNRIVASIGKLGVPLQKDVMGSTSAPTLAPTPAPTPSTAPSQPQFTTDQQHMLDLINQERSKVGVGSLKIDSQLQPKSESRGNGCKIIL